MVLQVAGLIIEQQSNIIECSAPAMKDKTKQSERANVLGVGLSPINLDLALAAVAEALDRKTKGYVCATGVHGVSEAQRDPAFCSILNRSFLNTPDGMPMVWMGRWQGFRDMARVYGPDLMLRVCELSQARGWTHFLYGGAPGVAEELRRRLVQRFPGLKIVGVHTPPFRPLTVDEERELVRQVGTLKPDIFWVGLSTPKQEKFMARYWQELEATLFFGVGAAFDFHAGRMRQAPRWMQRSGLEWLFRLACEPGRLWKRYLVNNPLFIFRALCQLTGIRNYRLEQWPRG
jgi:N-acetylglucosaminyldiphosphoundecaprenol N-acetyl-beta-D-mannosaminyltransferase